MSGIDRVGVVVPCRDEQRRLAGCLAALDVARRRVDLPVHVVVVLDGCTDRSPQIVRQHRWVHPLVIDARSVGVARAAGAALVARVGEPARQWIATTDADSRVPPDWLLTHLSLAAGGVDAVVGTISVSPATAAACSAHGRVYDSRDGHRHVHGANLGVRASAYRAAGGFRALATAEDCALVAALPAERVHRTGRSPVRTSGRWPARAPAGFAWWLRRHAAGLG